MTKHQWGCPRRYPLSKRWNQWGYLLLLSSLLLLVGLLLVVGLCPCSCHRLTLQIRQIERIGIRITPQLRNHRNYPIPLICRYLTGFEHPILVGIHLPEPCNRLSYLIGIQHGGLCRRLRRSGWLICLRGRLRRSDLLICLYGRLQGSGLLIALCRILNPWGLLSTARLPLTLWSPPLLARRILLYLYR